MLFLPLKLAVQIVDSLAADWKPEQYHDTYTDQVKEIIWSMFSWTEGEFAFVPEKPLKAGVVKIAVFPGQFDPITNGHLDVIRRGVSLFDELIVAVGVNPEKKEMFTLQERSDMIRSLLKGEKGVRVEQYTGLTMDFVRQTGAIAILRGIRDVSDLRLEFQLAQANRAVGGVETVFIMTGDQYALTSRSLGAGGSRRAARSSRSR